MAVSTNEASFAATEKRYTTDFVISKDGTRIGYRQFGQGPGVVLIQGTMGTAHNFMQLAEALADRFTVYVPDRRGRGMSKSGGNDYSVQKEVEDLEALLVKTGARSVFGLSSGALIALQAALTLPEIQKVAVFEPPLFINGAPTDLIRRYEREMADGKVAAALITAMQAAQFGPPIFNLIPRWLLERFVSMGMAQEEKKGAGEYLTMRQLAPTLRNDFQVIVEMSGKAERFTPITTELLLMGGSKSPTYLRTALDALEQALPHARRVELAGLDHSAAWNSDKGGQPQVVAQELRRFFA
jgi:pimeloyl-ACP methyl ester carboxylesterase